MDIELELSILDKGKVSVLGIDEVGRGPLAGPVVSGAVLVNRESLDNFSRLSDLNVIRDSKKLSASKREELALIIKDFFVCGIGISDPNIIDEFNIRQATFLAMKKAIGAIRDKVDFILVDGSSLIPNISIPQKSIIKGDNSSFSIAAASIIAKVARDKMMEDLDKKYPGYFLAKHKGYGTKLHLDSLRQKGPCPIHRKSFAPVKKTYK